MSKLDDELRRLAARRTHEVDESSILDAVRERTSRRRRARPFKRAGLIGVAIAIAIASFVPLSVAFRKTHEESSATPHSTTSPTLSPASPTVSSTPPMPPTYSVSGTLVLTPYESSTKKIFTATGVAPPKPVRLPHILYNMAPSLSPDGTHMVAMAGEMQQDLSGTYLAIADLRTGRVTSMGQFNPFDAPAWSPDGKTIAFFNAANRLESLLLIRPDGTVIDSLYSHTFDCVDTGLSWSPDGKHLAFARANCAGGARDSIHVIAVDHSGDRQVFHLNGYGVDIRSPAWSPDGSTLAFEDVSRYPNKIYLVKVDGSNLHVLAKGVSCPVWSPDGSVIAASGASDASLSGAGWTNRVEFLNLNGTTVGRLQGIDHHGGAPLCPTSWLPAH